MLVLTHTHTNNCKHIIKGDSHYIQNHRRQECKESAWEQRTVLHKSAQQTSKAYAGCRKYCNMCMHIYLPCFRWHAEVATWLSQQGWRRRMERRRVRMKRRRQTSWCLMAPWETAMIWPSTGLSAHATGVEMLWVELVVRLAFDILSTT